MSAPARRVVRVPGTGTCTKSASAMYLFLEKKGSVSDQESPPFLVVLLSSNGPVGKGDVLRVGQRPQS